MRMKTKKLRYKLIINLILEMILNSVRDFVFVSRLVNYALGLDLETVIFFFLIHLQIMFCWNLIAGLRKIYSHDFC